MRIGTLAVGIVLAFVAGVVDARPYGTEGKFSFERSLFLLAERALTGEEDGVFLATRQVLSGYPLLQYLDYRRLARNLSAADPGEIAAFLEAHDDGPLAPMLRSHYLDHLAKEGRWSRFLQFAGNDDSLSTELTCYRLQALLQTGGRAVALAQVEPIWLHGQSRPKACDPALEEWRADGLLTTNLAWQRLELAMEANQTSLASYLRRYLSANDRRWADRWLELDSDPARITNAGFRADDHPAAGRMLERTFLRLIQRDPVAALAAWSSHGRRLGLDAPDLQRIQHALALRLAVRGLPEALPFMASLPESVFDDQLRQWQLRAGLRNRDWAVVVAAIEAMSPDTSAEAQWQYWYARALERLGRRDEAARAYRHAAQERNFFGFMAADRLDQPYRIDHRPLSVPPDLQQQVARIPAVERMRELVLLERLPEARREWSHMIDDLTPSQQEAAARLFADWGWHDRAIFTVARARNWGDIDLRFPLAFTDLILDGARNQDVDPAWAMAIARQESAFLHDVRSSAGALGIMQIMPATGRSVASSAGVRIRNNNDILDPANNTRLGTYYLRRNLDGFGGHSLLSTAAYNAGAHRVRSWLPEAGQIDPDIWMELIPFHETRDYVQRVFAYRIIYAVRLGLTPPSLNAILFPVTPSDRLAQAREDHLSGLGIPGPRQVTSRSYCDAPGYTAAGCI